MVYKFCFYVEKKSVEYEAFIQFHNDLNKVLRDKSYIPHFVSAKVISLSDVHHTSNLPDNERALKILKKTSGLLECGENQNFYRILKVLQDHDNPYAQKLVEDIKVFIERKDPSTRNTGTAATPTKGSYVCLEIVLRIGLNSNPHTHGYIHCS